MREMHIIFKFLRNRELDELYASIAIRTFALALIGIFIPIFLLKSGFSLSSVFLFYIEIFLFKMFLLLIAGKIASKIGFKHSILLSMPLLIIFFILLYTLQIFMWPLWLLAFVDSFSTCLFWIGYHVDFSKNVDSGKWNKELCTAKILCMILKAAGPFLGGIIAALFGFPSVFIIVSILLIFSVIPLFFTKDIHQPTSYSIKKMFSDINVKKLMGSMSNGFQNSIGAIVWPTYVFLFIARSYSLIGLATSMALALSLIATFFIGRIPDSKSKHMLAAGAWINSIISFFRVFVWNIFQVFILDSIYWINRMLIDISFDLRSYKKTNNKNRVEMIVLRESTIALGELILFTILYFFSDFIISFILGGITSPLLGFF